MSQSLQLTNGTCLRQPLSSCLAAFTSLVSLYSLFLRKLLLWPAWCIGLSTQQADWAGTETRTITCSTTTRCFAVCYDQEMETVLEPVWHAGIEVFVD
jgi:hypothetical protein